MTRRCQMCERMFPGDVCPGCGFDHVIRVTVTEAERKGDARPTAPDNRGIRP